MFLKKIFEDIKRNKAKKKVKFVLSKLTKSRILFEISVY